MNIGAWIGRFTAEPELKYTQNNVAVTSFCLAVDRKYQPQGEEKKTDFIDFVAWRNTAEFICKYFGKGSLIGVEGEVQTRNYTDKNGNNRKATEIVVSNVTFCGSKAGNSENSSQVANDPLDELKERAENLGFTQVADDSDDDLPF